MGQARDLGIELEARLALGLRELELALLVLADVVHPDLLAEVGEDAVLRFVDHRRERVHLLLDLVVCGLRLHASGKPA